MKNISSVLFVCTGNTCRSPMAEAMFNAFAMDEGIPVFATSAGAAAYEGMPASIGAISAMQGLGIDLSHHIASNINEVLLSEADIVLCMQPSHKRLLQERYPQQAAKIHTLLGYAHGDDAPIDDPFGGDANEYAACAEKIAMAVKVIIEKIKSEQ